MSAPLLLIGSFIKNANVVSNCIAMTAKVLQQDHTATAGRPRYLFGVPNETQGGFFSKLNPSNHVWAAKYLPLKSDDLRENYPPRPLSSLFLSTHFPLSFPLIDLKKKSRCFRKRHSRIHTALMQRGVRYDRTASLLIKKKDRSSKVKIFGNTSYRARYCTAGTR